MAWPIASDYFEAVQNPRSCFDDADLKAGVPALTPLGLPRPITGAFASVYQFTCPSGQWAVRCFLRDFDDQQRRYDALDHALRAANLPCMVGFQFQTRGIRVNGQWFPVVKMQWIDGESLAPYVSRSLSRPDDLRALARQWSDTMSSLRKAGIAHGDLQHGNVLISQSKVRLIDYDGMYVPALSGLGSHEEGHRNYQHPARKSQFTATIDNFSAWVVFISLSVLAIEPKLWPLLNGGDECLIFRKDDFERPERSKAFQLLDRSGKPELRALSVHFRSLLRLPVEQVPSLDGSAKILAPSATVRPPSGSASIPDWLRGQVPATRAEPLPSLLPPEPPPTQTATADWLIDHLVDQKPVIPVLTDFNFMPERVLLSLIPLIVVLVRMLSGGSFAIALSTVAVTAYMGAFACFLSWRYESLGVRKNKVHNEQRESRARESIRQTEKDIGQVLYEIDSGMEPLAALDKEYRTMPSKLQTDLQALYVRLDRVLSKVSEERAALPARELDAIRESDERHLAEIRSLSSQVGAIAYAESNEISGLVATLRNNYIASALRSAFISHATIAYIGPTLKDRMRDKGVYCAADVDHRIHHVTGMGPQKIRAMEEWKAGVQHRASISAPTPSAADVAAVKQTHEQQRQRINSQISAIKAREATDRQTLTENFTRYLWQLDQEEIDAKQKWASPRTVGAAKDSGRAVRWSAHGTTEVQP